MDEITTCYCDKCNKPMEIELKEEYLGAMLTYRYFECPHCGRKYVVLVEDKKSRNMYRIKALKERAEYLRKRWGDYE